MDPVAAGSALALIISASIGVYVVRAQNRVFNTDADDTIADTVIKLGQRVSVLERELSALRHENHVLHKWSAVLIEQLVKAEVAPMTYDEFVKQNGYGA